MLRGNIFYVNLLKASPFSFKSTVIVIDIAEKC